MKRDYINERDWKPAEIEGILDRAAEVKKRPADYRQRLDDSVVGGLALLPGARQLQGREILAERPDGWNQRHAG